MVYNNLKVEKMQNIPIRALVKAHQRNADMHGPKSEILCACGDSMRPTGLLKMDGDPVNILLYECDSCDRWAQISTYEEVSL